MFTEPSKGAESNLQRFYEIKLAEQKLYEILEDIVNMGIKLDDEVKEILKPYVHDMFERDSADGHEDLERDIENMLSGIEETVEAQETLEEDDYDMLGVISYDH